MPLSVLTLLLLLLAQLPLTVYWLKVTYVLSLPCICFACTSAGHAACTHSLSARLQTRLRYSDERLFALLFRLRSTLAEGDVDIECPCTRPDRRGYDGFARTAGFLSLA